MRSANIYQDKHQDEAIFVSSTTHFFIPFLQKKRQSESSGFRSTHNVSPYNYSFTFTGKEKDSETGFSYFGARYYDSDLSGLFLSVDPMADKYPNISPYAYCAWNPVKLVDQDGEDPVFLGLLEYYGKAKYGNSHLGETQKIGNFHVVPFYDNNNNLIGYNAGRYRSDGSYVAEYQMEPGDLKLFSKKHKLYEAAANLVYCAGEPDWSTVAFGSGISSGNNGGALTELGKMWGNALSAPSFYLATTLSIISSGNSTAIKRILRDIGKIESMGGKVTNNPLRASQELNMAIVNRTQKNDLRVESHPLSTKLGGNGKTPIRHMNVDYYERRGSEWLKKKSNHIILE